MFKQKTTGRLRWKDSLHYRFSRRGELWFRVYFQNVIRFLWVVALLWVIEFVDQRFFDERLQGYGARPGNWSHWEGIFFHPFLHNDWGHVFRNTVVLLSLGPIILIRGWNYLFHVSFHAALGSGILIMLIGEPNSVHSGASGVVYGYAFFLMAIGFYERTPLTIVFSIFAVSSYWYFTSAMFPTERMLASNISWEGHLGGAIGGLIAARRMSRIRI